MSVFKGDMLADSTVRKRDTVLPAADVASKNQVTLADFAKFCGTHPELRFWQALRAWSCVRFIFIAKGDEAIRSGQEIAEIAKNAGLFDTFYRDGK